MLAANYVGDRTITIEEREPEPLNPGEVRLAVAYVGICGTAHANDPYGATELKYVYTASFADYNSAYVAPTNTIQATVSASIAAGNIVISWTPAGGTLQSSPTVGQGAAWTAVGTANPATIPVSGTAKFFRVAP